MQIELQVGWTELSSVTRQLLLLLLLISFVELVGVSLVDCLIDRSSSSNTLEDDGAAVAATG